MANHIVQELGLQIMKKFAYSFSETKSIFWDEDKKQAFHNGEYGVYRESIVKELFGLILPSRFGVGDGFIVTNTGEVSAQCDVIVFDKTITPNIESDGRKKFFTIESVIGIGEIKSSIFGQTELSNYLNKLAKIKGWKEKIVEPSIYPPSFEKKWDPRNNPLDLIFTFLICSDFTFKDTDPEKIVYESGIEYRHRHNMVLSIKDGLYLYEINGNSVIPFPNIKETNMKGKFVRAGTEDFPIHLKHFLSYLTAILNMMTVLKPDMMLYLSDNVVLAEK